MDPNRFVERMLQNMYDATKLAKEGKDAEARDAWDEVKDNLDDAFEWMAKGGFLPTLPFNFEIFD